MATSTDRNTKAPKQRGWLHQLRALLARFVLRRLTKRQTPVPAPPGTTTDKPTPIANGHDASVLTFKLRISPGGPMAPVLELLIGPMLEPAAEDLAAHIKGAVEA